MAEPPVARYRLTLTIKGNTLDEITSALIVQTMGGFLLDSDYGKRHSWNGWADQHDARSLVRLIEPEWREATP